MHVLVDHARGRVVVGALEAPLVAAVGRALDEDAVLAAAVAALDVGLERQQRARDRLRGLLRRDPRDERRRAEAARAPRTRARAGLQREREGGRESAARAI